MILSIFDQNNHKKLKTGKVGLEPTTTELTVPGYCQLNYMPLKIQIYRKIVFNV
jgi:hypothetical protein